MILAVTVKITVSHLLYGLQNMFCWNGVMSDALKRYKKQQETPDHATKFSCLHSALFWGVFIRTLSFLRTIKIWQYRLWFALSWSAGTRIICSLFFDHVRRGSYFADSNYVILHHNASPVTLDTSTLKLYIYSDKLNSMASVRKRTIPTDWATAGCRRS
jgi:hypothetical protein